MSQKNLENALANPLPLIVLGSSSPRRRELLSHVCAFEVIKPDVEEIPKAGEAPRAYAARNAREKGEWVLSAAKSRFGDGAPQGIVVISADTIVVVDDRILEKPADAEHARQMLQMLSGRSHTVISGLFIKATGMAPDHKSIERQVLVESTVTFKRLTPPEIDHYIQTGEPFDKAGGYAAQGIGSYMVQRIEGSYSNVVGLPMAELITILEHEFGCSFW